MSTIKGVAKVNHVLFESAGTSHCATLGLKTVQYVPTATSRCFEGLQAFWQPPFTQLEMVV